MSIVDASGPIHLLTLWPDQTFVFLSRSALSLGLPPIPKHLLPLPAVIQFSILSLLSLQASQFIFSSRAYTPPSIPPAEGSDGTITIVFLLMCLEGLCGGSAYVNTFYHVGREGEDGGEGEEGTRRKMEREFRIGATGASDSLGQLLLEARVYPLKPFRHPVRIADLYAIRTGSV